MSLLILVKTEGIGTLSPLSIYRLNNGATSDQGYGLAVDSSKNIHVTGDVTSFGQGQGDGFACQINPNSETITWQRTLGTANNEQGESMDIDSSGNVYTAGYKTPGASSASDIWVSKYNSSGTLQWQRRISHPSSQSLGPAIAVDSSGNPIVALLSIISGVESILVKLDSSGTQQWITHVAAPGGNNVNFRGLDTDSSDNVYVVGESNTGGVGNNIITMKFNSSGTLQWQRKLDGSGTDNGNSVAVDSSGNVYISAWTDSIGAGGMDWVIAKYNTSGVLQWQRTLGEGSSDNALGIAVDSSGDVYVTGSNFNGGVIRLGIAKYNSSGVLQWQNRMDYASTTISTREVVVDNDYVYVVGHISISGNVDIHVFRVPSDGTGAGTYGSFTYGTATMTDAAGTLTDAAGVQNVVASSHTTAADSMTDAASSYTLTVDS